MHLKITKKSKSSGAVWEEKIVKILFVKYKYLFLTREKYIYGTFINQNSYYKIVV